MGQENKRMPCFYMKSEGPSSERRVRERRRLLIGTGKTSRAVKRSHKTQLQRGLNLTLMVDSPGFEPWIHCFTSHLPRHIACYLASLSLLAHGQSDSTLYLPHRTNVRIQQNNTLWCSTQSLTHNDMGRESLSVGMGLHTTKAD